MTDHNHWIRDIEDQANRGGPHRRYLLLNDYHALTSVLADLTRHMRWHGLDDGYDVCPDCEKIIVPELAAHSEPLDCTWHILGRRAEACETCRQFGEQERAIRWRMGEPV